MSSEGIVFLKKEHNYLPNQAFARKQTESELECSMHCVRNDLCSSVNYKTTGIGKGLCELNEKTTQKVSGAGEKILDPEFNHLVIVKRVSKNDTFNMATGY